MDDFGGEIRRAERRINSLKSEMENKSEDLLDLKLKIEEIELDLTRLSFKVDRVERELNTAMEETSFRIDEIWKHLEPNKD